MVTPPLWQQYLGVTSGLGTGPVQPEVSPDVQSYLNALTRAQSLGLEDATGEREKGLLGKGLELINVPRAAIYATARGLGDVLAGEGFDASDFMSRYERAVEEGEGFGSTEFLSVDPGDSLIEKGLKFGTSFVLDVGADPLTYVTLGTGTVAKGALGGLAKASATRGLREITEVAARQAGEELAEVGSKAITRDLAKKQLSFGTKISANGERIRLTAGEAAEAAAKLTDEQATELATERLADVIATSRVAGTSRTVRQTIAKELNEVGFRNADEAAQKVVSVLDPEFRGGLRLSVPFAREGVTLTPGGGAVLDRVGLGGVADAANRARLVARAAIRGERSILGNIGGESGAAYGTLVRALRDAADPFEVLNRQGAPSARQVSQLMAANQAKRTARNQFLRKADNRVTEVVTAENNLIASGVDRAAARRVMTAAYHGYRLGDTLTELGLSADDEAVRQLVSGAEGLARLSDDIAELRGFEPDPLYRPRILTDEALDDLSRTRPQRQGSVSRSNPDLPRVAFEDISAELDEASDIVKVTRTPKSIPEINELMRQRGRDFNYMIEDPLEIVTDQVRRQGTIIETEAFINALAKEGLIRKAPSSGTASSAELANELRDNVENIAGSANRLNNANRSSLPDVVEEFDRAKDELTRAIEESDGIRQRASESLNEVRSQLKEARRSVARAETAVKRAEGKLARAATADDAAEVARLKRQASRLTRERDEAVSLRDNLDVAVNEAERVATEADIAYKTARIERIAAQVDAIDKFVVGTQDARVAALRQTLVGATDEQIAAFEQAVEAAVNLQTRRQVVSNAVEQREQLSRFIRSATSAERETSRQVQEAFKAVQDIQKRIEGSSSLARSILEQTKNIQEVLDSTGNWEEVSRAYAQMVRDVKAAGGSEALRKQVVAGRRLAERLGKESARADMVEQELIRGMGMRYLSDFTRQTRYPQKFDGWLVSDWLTESLDNMYRITGSRQTVQSNLAPYIDPYMRLFKTWATLGRGPGYHVRNFIGGMVNNWLLGVKRDAVKPAWNIARTISRVQKEVNDGLADINNLDIVAENAQEVYFRKLEEALDWTVGGRWGNIKAYQVARDFYDEGVQFARTNELLERAASEAARRSRGDAVGDKLANFAESRLAEGFGWVDLNARFAEEGEILLRMGAFLEGYARFGGDRQAAGLFAKAGHFDYQDLTDTERSLKFILPFYTWTRYNIPFQMRQVINNPGSLNRLQSLQANFQAAFEDPNGEGVVPEWMERRGGFETSYTFRGNKIGFMVESPQLDLFEIFGNDSRWQPIDPAELFEGSNPLIKSAYELFTGRDARTGIEADPLRSARNLIPPLNQFLRLGGITDSDKERQMSSWLSTMGVPVATISEGSVRNELRQRVQRLSEDVNAAVAPYLKEGEELDTRWLTQMAESGRTPDQIITLIKQGYGRVGGPKLPDDRASSPASLLLRNYLG